MVGVGAGLAVGELVGVGESEGEIDGVAVVVTAGLLDTVGRTILGVGLAV